MDLIDRKAMLKHIEKIRQDALMMDDIRESNIIMMGMNLCEEAVRNQPSAQPEPKTGRWIADGQKQKHGNKWMHCSVCGFSDIDVPATHTNYCPNCEARMEGEDNEAD